MSEEKITIRKGKDKDGLDNIVPVHITIHKPDRDYPKTITEEDVWGKIETNKEIKDIFEKKEFDKKIKEDRGMIVAEATEKCPIFGDIVPYKCLTVAYPTKKEDEVLYWIEHKCGPIIVHETKKIDDLRTGSRIICKW